jgi:hypothetical protein
MSSPSSGPPSTVPGLPQSGNAKYAVVAILLVVATGGIFAWRSMSSQTAPPGQVVMMSSASASATAATTSTFDDIPPPPTIQDKPEAHPSAKVATAGGGGGGAAGGCDKTCTGSATNELQAALQVRGQLARRCYNQALQGDSTLKGHVSITVRVGGSGSVCSVGVGSNDMSTPAVANCAANMFRNATYPPPHGGCIDVAVPLSFVPQGN